MPEVAIVINVSNEPLMAALGTRGIFTVPAKREDEDFGMLVIREARELQNVAGMAIRREPVPARETANDILNYGMDWRKKGLLICAVEPDEPKELQKAEQAEREYLNKNKPRIEYEVDEGILKAINKQDDKPQAIETKTRLSKAVQKAWADFEATCRKLVRRDEVEKATKALLAEDQRLVAAGDQLYANEMTRREITNVHQNACRRMGQERPWCYTPTVMEDCEGCGQKVKKGVAICGHCGAVLDDAKAKKLRIGPYAPEFATAKAS